MDGITINVLGDYGPFSRVGKSIGYQVRAGGLSLLLDCGAPLFQQIGGHGLKEVEAVIITHCHEDHKRWLSDIALFSRYAPDMKKKIRLITSESVHDDIIASVTPSLITSLSNDSMTVTDIPYEDFITYQMLGPRARFRIVSKDEGCGKRAIYIADRRGNAVPPGRAKIIISKKTGKPRMLFKDPQYREWVEPDSFYPFSSPVFYEEDKNIFRSADGASVEAIKAPVWHGLAGIGIKIRKDGESMIFSSDTAHNTELWKKLCSEKRLQKMEMPKKEFQSASIIYGDINDYIERIWSRERYQAAVDAFRDAAVLHDISSRNSVVHTDYDKLGKTTLRKDRALLTHSPDRFTSEWALCNAGKTFLVNGNQFHEVVNGKVFPMNADIYHKERGKYYVGYKNRKGKHTVYEKNGLLRFVSFDGSEIGRPLFKVDLYEDVSGAYFPVIYDKNAIYYERADGKVEMLEFNERGSNGKLVRDRRAMLARKNS